MPLNNPLFLLPALAGLIFVIAGAVMLKYPPKKINWFYGYRTSGSMKSKERWDFAQTYAAKEMIKLGVLLMFSSLIGLVFAPHVIVSMGISMGLLFLLVIVLLVKTESAIKRKFPEK